MKPTGLKTSKKKTGVVSKIEPENVVTIKEVFTRVVSLETKWDMQIVRNEKLGKYFWTIIGIMLLVEIINMGFNYFLYLQNQEVARQVAIELLKSDQK